MALWHVTKGATSGFGVRFGSTGKPSLSRKGMENNRLTEKIAKEIGEDKGNKFFH